MSFIERMSDKLWPPPDEIDLRDEGDDEMAADDSLPPSLGLDDDAKHAMGSRLVAN